jgi:hypothetical protein
VPLPAGPAALLHCTARVPLSLPCHHRAAHPHRTPAHHLQLWRLLEALGTLPRKALSSEQASPARNCLRALVPFPATGDVGRRQLSPYTRILLLLPITFVRLQPSPAGAPNCHLLLLNAASNSRSFLPWELTHTRIAFHVNSYRVSALATNSARAQPYLRHPLSWTSSSCRPYFNAPALDLSPRANRPGPHWITNLQTV